MNDKKSGVQHRNSEVLVRVEKLLTKQKRHANLTELLTRVTKLKSARKSLKKLEKSS